MAINEGRTLEKKECFKTKVALFWMNLTNEPLVALYTLLPFILRKDLGATAFQLSLFIALRPVLSMFSFYWGASLPYQKKNLLSNLIGAWIIARIPFLFLPLFDNVWYLMFAAGVYQLFYRAGNPALMEILKLNLPKVKREKAFSMSFVLSFIESVILGISIGTLLDKAHVDWHLLLFFAALIGLTSFFFQKRIPMQQSLMQEEPAPGPQFLKPWKDAFQLMRSRPDFAQFQWAFMIGGFGLMLLAPALPIFYVDVLELSHSNIAIARFVLMGIGVVSSSFLWRRGIEKLPLSKLTGFVLIGFCQFPLTLLLALFYPSFLYLAFFLYGIAQAGSHLIWNLSGLLFSGDDESSKYSNVNILMVGLRGAVGPLLGGLFCDFFGPIPILVCGVIIFSFGGWLMLYYCARPKVIE